MLQARHGEEFASGMTATGFWAGLAAGRIALGFVTPRVGERFAVMVCLLCSLGFWENADLCHTGLSRSRHMPTTSLLADPAVLHIGHHSFAPGILSRAAVSSHHDSGNKVAAKALTRQCYWICHRPRR